MPTNSAKSKAVWRHNSLLGGATMAMRNMEAVGYSPTTTAAAKAQAQEIYRQLTDLKFLLKDRVDANS